MNNSHQLWTSENDDGGEIASFDTKLISNDT